VFKHVHVMLCLVGMIGMAGGCYQESRRMVLEGEKAGASQPSTAPAKVAMEEQELALPGPALPSTAPTSTRASGHKIRVVIETNLGHMEAELWPDVAPMTVANFVRLAEEGFYENLPCHRMIPGFMVQLGKPVDPMRAAQVQPIKGEFSQTLKHGEGVLSMARLPSDPDSATAQFFICFKPRDDIQRRALASLDGKYAIFGKVTKGLDVLNEIESVPTTTQPMGPGRQEPSKPEQPIILRAVRVLR
jgi:peptidyl-prolyl cis-trans isomerase B (cyclophilin B)